MSLLKMTMVSCVAALGLAATASAGGVQTSPFEPNDQASCAGLFSVVEHFESGIWPSRPVLEQIVQAHAASKGVSPGELYAAFAQGHAGVYAHCDLANLGTPLP